MTAQRDNVILHMQSSGILFRLGFGICKRAKVRVPQLVLIDLQIGNTDDREWNLGIRLEQRLIEISKKVISISASDIAWLGADYQSRISTWERLVRAYFQEFNFDAIAYLIYFENWYRSKNYVAEPGKIICYFEPACFGPETARAFEPEIKFPTELRVKFSNRYLKSLLSFVPGNLTLWKSLIVKSVIRPDGPPRPGDRATGNTACMIMQQYTPDTFTRYPAAGHFYWFDQSGIEPQRVVLYFNRLGERMDAEIREKISKLGIQSLEFSNIIEAVDRPLKFLFRMIMHSGVALFSERRFLRFHYWSIISRYYIVSEAYRTLIRRLNIVAAKQSLVFTPEVMALAMALKMEGAILLWNFWSIHKFFEAPHYVAEADLVFAWGPYHEGYIRAQDFRFSWIFQVGLIQADGIDDGDVPMIEALRARVNPTAELVISVFDTSFGPTVSISEDQVVDFYETVIQMLSEHPNWAALAKPKRDWKDLNLRKETRDQLEQLELEHRFYEVDWKAKVGVVARASHLAVCASPNTAGFAAALLGVPTLHLDLGGMRSHPFHLWGGDGKIFFRSTRALTRAVEAFASGDRNVGDHSEWLDLIDPFNDGVGRLRVGKLLKRYLDCRDQGLDADQSMDILAAEYSQEMGVEHVIGFGDMSASPGTELWSRTIGALSGTESAGGGSAPEKSIRKSILPMGYPRHGFRRHGPKIDDGDL